MTKEKLKSFSIYQKIHFIGIGGIGISALARIFKREGHDVSGTDQSKSLNTDLLISEGIDVKVGHSASLLPNNTSLVIYTRAIPQDNPELIAAKSMSIPIMSYPEAIGKLTENYKTISICGTHGKTTTTAMLGKILLDAGVDPTVIVGSIVKDFDQKNELLGKSNVLVLESCEYQESFLNYKPHVIILNNIEPEHLDYFKNEENYVQAFSKFIKLLPKNGLLIANGDDPNICKLLNSKQYSFRVIRFGRNTNNEFILNGTKISTPQNGEHKIELAISGDHNYMNATAAFIGALTRHISPEIILKSLKNFSGASRRFELKGKIGNTVIIDDYGHAPTEIQATLKAAKEKFGKESKILCVFQPHQYSRTHLFLKEFGKSFIHADKVFIPNIYKSRDSEEDIKSVNVNSLVEEINKHTPNKAENTLNFELTLDKITKEHNKYDVIMTVGAGDITDLSEKILSI